MHYFALIAFVLYFGTASLGLPTKNEGKAPSYSTFKLTGPSGSFSYPVGGGEYKNDDRVLVAVSLPPRSLFTIESTDLEGGDSCSHDKLTLSKWEGRNFVLNGTFCGLSTSPKHFLPTGDFLLAFSSDSSVTRTGFNLSWAPIEFTNKIY